MLAYYATLLLYYATVRNTADVISGKPIAVWLQSISDVSDINPSVAFYDFHGRKREVLLIFFYSVHHTRRIRFYFIKICKIKLKWFIFLCALGEFGVISIDDRSRINRDWWGVVFTIKLSTSSAKTKRKFISLVLHIVR
jgi:hypothetical protein